MNWVHCNKCYAQPSNSQTFLFTSCGHLFCSKCVSKEENNETCKLCKKKCGYLEINRTLKPEAQMYFKNPRDLIKQYAQNVRAVFEFQNFQRNRLQKHQNEKSNKAIKYVKQIQADIAKKVERERSVLAECKRLKLEFKRQAHVIQNLEKALVEKDGEISQMRQKLSKRQKSSKNVFPNLNGNTPMPALSFLHCATSTPISGDADENMFGELNNNIGKTENNSKSKGGDSAKLKHTFTAPDSDDFDSSAPGSNNSGGGMTPGDFLNTPAMLGISQSGGGTKRRAAVANLF